MLIDEELSVSSFMEFFFGFPVCKRPTVGLRLTGPGGTAWMAILGAKGKF